MKQIALIDPSLFTLPYDTALAAALQRAGLRVDLHGRPPEAGDGRTNGITVLPSFYRVAAAPFSRRLPKPARLAIKGIDHVASMSRLRRALRRDPPDIIHFQWLPLPAIDARLLPGFRRIAPVVLTVHDTDPFNGSPTAKLQRMGFAASLAACDRLIVHTAQGAARLAALGIAPSRIAILPHGPLGAHATGAPVDRMDGEITFVLFGKIKPYKGADLLIEAFAAMPEAARHHARLHIIGQAYMDLEPLRRLAIERGIADRLTLEPRFVEDAEIPAIFAPGRIAVFPYREIEASGVLSLALAQGRPIIASRLGSFAETVTDGVQGRLLQAGDVQALSDAMRLALGDRAETARYAAQASRLSQALPGWDEIARMTQDVYADAAKAAASRGKRHPVQSLAVKELVQ